MAANNEERLYRDSRNSCSNEATDGSAPGYVLINGTRIPLTREQLQAWRDMINRNRRYARRFGLCGQPEYQRCRGDCGMCPWHTEGMLISSDDRVRYGDGYATGRYAPVYKHKSPEKEVEDAESLSWLYREADKAVRSGSDILRLYLEDGMSASQISGQMGIAKSTVVDRLNRLLAFIREHRDDLI